MITQDTIKATLEAADIDYVIDDRGTWFEVETFKDGTLHYRKRSFEPDFEEDIEHYLNLHAQPKEDAPMITTTYKLTGVWGTQLTVTVQANPHNVATNADVYINAVSDDAPDYFSDALSIEDEFLIARCFDGSAVDGEQWALALDEDGQLTHEAMAVNPQYVETFTINVKEHAA